MAAWVLVWILLGVSWAGMFWLGKMQERGLTTPEPCRRRHRDE